VHLPANHGSKVTLGILVGLTLFVGGLGSFATASEIQGWYTTLQKPDFNPPNWVFGPVWTTLYILMAVSLWLIWRAPSPLSDLTKKTWFVMLALNSAWSLLFFRGHSPGLALIDIGLYLVALSALIKLLSQQSRLAAWLQLPHLLWVSYAAVLNATIWLLNR
jgi:tryptophan-rich sensory protein